MWRLALRLSPHDLHAVTYSEVEAGSLTVSRWTLDAAPGRWLQSVEETVYDNPFLLGDYRKVNIVIEPRASMLIPDGIVSQADAVAITEAMLPGDNREYRADYPLGRDAAVGYAFESGLSRFVGRTWGADAQMMSHLTVLARYFMVNVRRGRHAGVLLNVTDNRADVIVVDGGSVRLCNSFTIRNGDEAAYFTLAAISHTGVTEPEIIVSGNSVVRETVLPMLRRFVKVVNPMIFPPQMFKAGREAVTAPFDLIISPLCE